MLTLINAGLGRTGTTSLKAALDRLDRGPSFHMFDIVGDGERLRQWEKVVCDGERPDWAALFAGYRAAVDGPCALYYRQLSQAFPDAGLPAMSLNADMIVATPASTAALNGGRYTSRIVRSEISVSLYSRPASAAP